MKRFFIISLMLLLCIGILSACGGKSLKPPISAENCIGQEYKSVESSFIGAGFTNVSKTELGDLEINEYDKVGTVKQVSIDGNTYYSTRDKFSPKSMVFIEYHSIKMVNAPISTNDAKIKEIEELSQLFKKSGFDLVTVEDVYDLDPDIYDVEFKNEVLINGVSIFGTDDKFPIDANISIIRHLPYKKYTVNMHVDFRENIIFSRYNVDLIISGEKMQTLEHGKNADFTFRLVEGEHTFRFSHTDTLSIKEDVTIEIKSDVDVVYRISCYNNKIDVEDVTEQFLAKQEKETEKARKAVEAAAAAEQAAVINELLEKHLQQEMAKRAAVVAITNYLVATDVYKDDGDTLDVSKFHSYSDTSGIFFDYYIGVKSWGDWTAKNEKTWQVNKLNLVNCFGNEFNVDLNVQYDGENYLVSNVVRYFGNLNDPSKSGVSEYSSEFVVLPKLIKDDRSPSRVDSYYSWVMNQFSSWDFSHRDFKKSIIKNLNDEKSFKHINTNYQIVFSTEIRDEINNLLRSSNKNARVEIGDIWISTEFTAKNAFNATIKSTAYGISSFSNNRITLVAIE